MNSFTSKRPIITVFITLVLNCFNIAAQDLVLEIPDNRKSDYIDYESFANNKIILSRNHIDPDYFEQYDEIQKYRAEYYAYLVRHDFFTWQSPTYFYVNKIFNNILDSNPEINQESVRLLLSRSSIPNAYSIGDGTIIINIGLINFFNNDDQIAFVLCHELAHYIKDHSNQKIIAQIEKDLNPNKKSYKKATDQTQLKEIIRSDVYDERRHQRVFEFEADSEGLELFRNTDYSLNQVPATIQHLDLIDSFSFNITAIQLLKSLKLELNNSPRPFESDFNNEVDIEALRWNQDSLSTHPACSERSKRLRDSLINISFKNENVENGDLRNIKMNVQAEMIESMMFFEQFDIALLHLMDNLDSGYNIGYSIGGLSYTFYNLANYRRKHILNYAIEKDEKNLEDVHSKLIEILRISRLDEMSRSFSNVIMDYYNQGYKSARMLYSLAMLSKFSRDEAMYLKFKKELAEEYPKSRYKIL